MEKIANQICICCCCCCCCRFMEEDQRLSPKWQKQTHDFTPPFYLIPLTMIDLLLNKICTDNANDGRDGTLDSLQAINFLSLAKICKYEYNALYWTMKCWQVMAVDVVATKFQKYVTWHLASQLDWFNALDGKLLYGNTKCCCSYICIWGPVLTF